MDINIKNAGAIENTTLNIEEGKLNIKFGINGVGKTTLAKAIFYKLSDEEQLNNLIMYGTSIRPKVNIPERFKSVIYFDKKYVENYLFKEDIINNSYEVIIKTREYDSIVSSVELMLQKIKDLANYNEYNEFINNISEFQKGFSLTSKNEVSKSSKIIKGLQNGDLLKHIDDKIEVYKKYILAANSDKWSKWFEQGDSFVQSDDNNCPYCGSDFPSNFAEIKDIIKNTFNSSRIKDNLSSKEQLGNISLYADNNQKQEIKKIVEEKEAPTEDKLEPLKLLYYILTQEKVKILKLREMSATNMTKMLSGNNIEIFLNSNKLNTLAYANFPNKERNLANEINILIDNLLSKLSEFKINLGLLQKELATSIQSTKCNVNNFLKISGIPYTIDIVNENLNDYKTVLKPSNVNMIISDPINKLSFGEQNAMALILFSLEAISKNPDLIILDDPVSSFDDTKKYALIYHLFKSGNQKNFYGKTVLMLTHDFSPIIDFIYNGKPNRGMSNASYLVYKNKNIIEKQITNESIENSIASELRSANNKENNLIDRLVHLRRHYELNGDIGFEYNLLSSLLHLYESPSVLGIDGNKENMKQLDLNTAERNIRGQIEIYDNYQNILKLINDNDYLIKLFNESTDFGKLNITRIFIEKNNINYNNEILWKYLCESYHIENNYLFYLNPDYYELIPDYILNECKKIVK